MPDCTCPKPDYGEGSGFCERCGGFACPYAPRGRTRCLPPICDCFIDSYPDSPFALHPEAFIVGVPCRTCGHVGLIGGDRCPVCDPLEGVDTSTSDPL